MILHGSGEGEMVGVPGGQHGEILAEFFFDSVDEFGHVFQKAVKKAIADNPQATADYKSGKVTAIQFLLGQVMRETKGKANPQVVEKLLQEAL